MKKILVTIVMLISLNVGISKPAKALVIDGGEIGGKISTVTQDVSDQVQMGVEKINKIKQMATQGFNFQSLLDAAKEYAMNFASAYLDKLINGAVEENTHAQNADRMDAERTTYLEAKETMYEKQKDQVTSEKQEVSSQLKSSQHELTSEKKEETRAKEEYDQETDPVEKEKKFAEYMEHKAQVEKLTSDVAELELLNKQLGNQQEKLNRKLDKIKKKDDDQYKAMTARIEALNKETDDNQLVKIDTGNEDWGDKISAEKYVLGKDLYRNFTERYFFDVETLNAKNEDKNTHQSRMDRIMRQRRYLAVSSAAHLLQVSASIRRELPSRYDKNKEVFEALGDANELADINVYSAVRVEGAKALLLYAKLLCAKLQYMAAHDLLKTEVQKTIGDADDASFDLGKYILRKQDIDALTAKFKYDDKSTDADKRNKYSSESKKQLEFISE